MQSTHYYRRNIRLFGLIRVFTKRVFLPLTTIYATERAGMSIDQIGLVTAAAAALSILTDTATGFWADKHGRRASARVGALLAALGSLTYVLSSDFLGILTASLVLALGYSFLGGAVDALVHDTLIAMKREDDYAKVVSRAQAASLVVNAGLIATIPLLYPVDKRLPFVAGFVCYMFLYAATTLLVEPPRPPHAKQTHAAPPSFFTAVRVFVHWQTLPFYVMLGLVVGIGTATSDVFNLGFVGLGLQPQFLGTSFAISSLLGAALGTVIHHLKRLSFRRYAAFDLLLLIGVFFTVGVVQWLPLAFGFFVIYMAFWRYQRILYQHYILQMYGGSRNKATILSLTSNFQSINEVWIALASTRLASHFGVLPSIGYMLPAFAIILPLHLVAISRFQAATHRS